MITLLSLLLGFAAIGALAGIVCRLDALSWRTHQPAVVAMHMALGVACVWALVEAVAKDISIGSAASVAATLCWLWTSLPTWAKGPPSHTHQHQEPVIKTPPPHRGPGDHLMYF